jgi:hypothetical protein
MLRFASESVFCLHSSRKVRCIQTTVAPLGIAVFINGPSIVQ